MDNTGKADIPTKWKEYSHPNTVQVLITEEQEDIVDMGNVGLDRGEIPNNNLHRATQLFLSLAVKPRRTQTRTTTTYIRRVAWSDRKVKRLAPLVKSLSSRTITGYIRQVPCADKKVRRITFYHAHEEPSHEQ